jgi:hypothetical protein
MMAFCVFNCSMSGATFSSQQAAFSRTNHDKYPTTEDSSLGQVWK